jgi:hypothetical protein
MLFTPESEVDRRMADKLDAEEFILLFIVVVVLVLKTLEYFSEVIAAEEVAVFLRAFEVVVEGLLDDGHEDV